MPTTRSKSLKEKLLDSSKSKMSSHESVAGTSTNTVLPNPLVPLPETSKKTPDVSLADLMYLIKSSAGDHQKLLEEVKVCFSTQVSEVQQKTDTAVKRIDVLETVQQTVHHEIEEIKSSIKNIQSISISTSNFQPPLNSTDNPSFQSNSSFSAERLADVVHQFTGNKNDTHPEDYLFELEQFFSTAFFTDFQKISFFKRRLWSRARSWFDALSPRPQSYNELLRLFRGQFWSNSIQRQVRNELLSPYSYNSPRGLVDHAIRWVSKAQYLNPPIDTYDLVGIITQHFPIHIKTAIIGRNPPNTNELLIVLAEMEEAPIANPHSNGSRPAHNARAQPNVNNNNNTPFQRNNYNNNPNRPVHAYRRNNDNRSRPSQNSNRPNNNTPRKRVSPQQIHQLNTTGNEEEAAA